uniref:uncharacterized protein LOC100183292 n=1 Tax=Ciona intestinalis TaxID=7719 RepID=UPI000180C539|nr:uncharacterized protein LOC100183292 [Ciona intestinalis]|eukprot:XP_002123656.3 uncharacterized protein LOC100183292 [Ciona intestinalis]
MGAVDNIENNIRTSLKTKRVRVSEFFKDFDRLRSGSITASQFKRCLDQFLGLKLSAKEIDEIADKYCLKDGMVNYRAFSDVIDQNFHPEKLEADPESQTVPTLEYLGTERSHVQLGPELVKEVDSILLKIQNYYTYHGVNIRTCYEDFDRHHNGLVTMSQFARRFPGPPDVTENEIKLLAQHYQDPSKPGMTNYLNFHHDVEHIKNVAAIDKVVLATTVSEHPSAVVYDDSSIEANPDLKKIFDQIRVAIYKNGIRTTEFFKDHDKLRSGVITENQFICGLSLGCGKEAHLTKKEIAKLAEHYKTLDGRVQYKAFCDIMENAFNVPGLEKKPTIHPVSPPSGALTRSLAQLSSEEEQHLVEVLSNLGEVVRKRRLLLYPYFKDYDRGVAYTRNVTKSQFARILHFLSLDVSEEDLKLLCRKFEEPTSQDVNYPAFCQAIDQEFNHYTVDASKPIPGTEYVPPPPAAVIDTSHINMNELIQRIQHHVLVNRIRVGEFFEDFDPLRSGSISRSIFTRGLNSMGVEWLDKVHVFALLEMYSDPKKTDCVLWTNFLTDIESVFTQRGLEKDPTKKVAPLESFILPKEGANLQWSMASENDFKAFEEAMGRMRSRAIQRRILAKPVFQDFDKHNNGHVTKSQFRQCLASLDLHADEGEVNAIECKFTDSIGFDYIRFLGELMPQIRDVPKYKEHLKELQAVNAHKKPMEIDALTDVQTIMNKIKIKVSKERMRVYEFMKDYDKLKTGRILMPNFKRALDLAGLELKESEVKLLSDTFQSPGEPDFCDYLAFSDEIESIFTLKHLEKQPLTAPTQFKPPVEWQLNTLSEEAEIVYNMAMSRVAEHVRKTRNQLFPLFEDYDRVHNGTVSRSQFHRVLSELEMGSLLSEQEFRVIFTKFNVRIGGKNDVNYLPFCDRIYEIARFDPFKP